MQCCAPHATRPGWVETAQHGLIFGFDITKVMFSSGNVTERKRMGHIGARPGEGGPSGQPSNDLEEVSNLLAYRPEHMRSPRVFVSLTACGAIGHAGCC